MAPRKEKDKRAKIEPPPPKVKTVKVVAAIAPAGSKDNMKNMVHYSGHIQLIAMDIENTSPSVLLFFDKERYMFNTGEGIQRFCREHKLRVSKIDQYFFTRICTSTLGGLPGMVLSTAVPLDAGGLLDKQATCIVNGPKGLEQYVDAFRSYVNQDHAVDIRTCGMTPGAKLPAPMMTSEVVSIIPIMVQPPPASKIASPRKLTPTSAASVPVVEAGVVDACEDGEGEQLRKKARRCEGETAQPAHIVSGGQDPMELDIGEETFELPLPAVCVYYCALSGRPGKFDPRKAMELGVAKGPLFGDLQRGNSVISAVTGETVTPDQVMNPPTIPGPAILIIDCPSISYLPSLQHSPQLTTALEAAQADGAGSSSDGSNSKLLLAVHMVPPSVWASLDYQAWLEGWGCHRWQHMQLSSGEGQACTLSRAAVLQAKMSTLHSGLFPAFKLASAHGPPVITPQPAAVATPESAVAETQEPSAAAAATVIIPPQEATAPAVTTHPDSSSSPHPTPPAAPEQASTAASSASAPQHTKDSAANGSSNGAIGGGSSSRCSAPVPVILPSITTIPLALTPAEVKHLLSPAVSLLRYHLMPQIKQGPDGVEQGGRVCSCQVAETFRSAWSEEMARLATALEIEAETEKQSGTCRFSRETLEVTFLGTASSQPSKYRNVSGTYLDFFGRGGMMVDCGEDSVGQMERRYGPKDAFQRVLSLQSVWISHMHADHHGGLYPLLQLRARAGAAPLLIMGPLALFEVLQSYSCVVPIAFIFVPADCYSQKRNKNYSHTGPAPLEDGLTRPLPASVVSALQALKATLGLTTFRPFDVDHIHNSYGLLLQGSGPEEGAAPWKVVFSGDTRPCESVVEAAQDATLLVHEATFEDELENEAYKKRHSTTGEAMGVATKSRAYRTILTHFSTRYPKLPEMDIVSNGSIAVAMDLMSVNLADLAWLPRIVEPLGLLLKAEKEGFEAEDEEGA